MIALNFNSLTSFFLLKYYTPATPSYLSSFILKAQSQFFPYLLSSMTSQFFGINELLAIHKAHCWVCAFGKACSVTLSPQLNSI